MSNQTVYYKTPIGTAKIVGDKNGIQSVSVLDDDFSSCLPNKQIQNDTNTPTCLQECMVQLEEYFKGERTEFTVKLNPQGTVFQQRVWKELLQIPFNKTRTYLEQSKALGDVKAIRAVAAANGKNPIWILIPCGIWRKKWLLAHENPVKQQSLF